VFTNSDKSLNSRRFFYHLDSSKSHKIRQLPGFCEQALGYRLIKKHSKLGAAGVPEHVGMDGEGEQGEFAGALKHLTEADRDYGAAALSGKEVRGEGISANFSANFRSYIAHNPAFRHTSSNGLMPSGKACSLRRCGCSCIAAKEGTNER
jgi:hypothetical protein